MGIAHNTRFRVNLVHVDNVQSMFEFLLPLGYLRETRGSSKISSISSRCRGEIESCSNELITLREYLYGRKFEKERERRFSHDLVVHVYGYTTKLILRFGKSYTPPLSSISTEKVYAIRIYYSV